MKRKRRAHALGAHAKRAVDDARSFVAKHPAATTGAVVGAAAGIAGAVPGALLGAAAGAVVDDVVKK